MGKGEKASFVQKNQRVGMKNFVVIAVVLDLPIIFYTRYSLISYDLIMKFHMEAG